MIKKIISYLASAFLQRLFVFLLIPFLSRYLSPEEFGKYIFALTSSSALLILFSFGLDIAVNRLYFDQQFIKENSKVVLIATALYGRIAISLLLGLLAFVSLSILANLYNPLSLTPLILAFIVIHAASQALLDTVFTVLRVLGNSRKYILVTSFSLTLSIAFISIFYFCKSLTEATPLLCLASANILAFVMSFFFLLSKQLTSIDNFDVKCLHGLLSYSYHSIPQKMGSWLGANGFRLQIAIFLSASALGGYQLMSFPSSVFLTVNAAIGNAYTPWQYRSLSMNTSPPKNVTYCNIIYLCFFFVASFAVIVFYKPLAYMLNPDESFKTIYFAMPFLGAACFLTVEQTFLFRSLHWLKMNRICSIMIFLPSITAFASGYVLIPQIGISGALIALIASSLASNLIGAYSCWFLNYDRPRIGLSWLMSSILLSVSFSTLFI